MMPSGSVPRTPSEAAVVGDRILLILVAGIGDFVLATPAIRAIRRGFPEADITLLTTPQTENLARACPYFHDVVTFDLRRYRPGEQGGGWGGWRRFREVTTELRRRRFALAVDLYQVVSWTGAARMALLLLRIGAQRTAGRWSSGRGVIFDVRSTDTLHEMEAMLGLAATLGGRPDDTGPTLWIPAASRQTAAEHLRISGIAHASRYMVLHVGSNRPEARLPEDKAAAIGMAIRCATNLPVILIGDKAEAPLTERLAAKIGGGSRSLAGQTDLLELAAILEGAHAAVTMDSGPMHLAAAVGTPLVVLFGPADPRRFGPRGRGGRIAILQGRESPHDPARWHTDIRTDDVLDALLTRVRDPRGPRGS